MLIKKQKKIPEKNGMRCTAFIRIKNCKCQTTNYEGSFIKSEIQQVIEKRTGSTGQSFLP
jgi:hypothetical protein